MLEERRKLEAAIQREQKGKGTALAGGAALDASSAVAAASGAAAQEGGVDALDAFMSDMQHQIEEDKVHIWLIKQHFLVIPASASQQKHWRHWKRLNITICCPDLSPLQHAWQAEMSRSDMQVAALQKEVDEINKQVAEAERMLKFADPGALSAASLLSCRDGFSLTLVMKSAPAYACAPC